MLLRFVMDTEVSARKNCVLDEDMSTSSTRDSARSARRSKAAAFERWAELVESHELVPAETESLRVIAELAEQRHVIESALLDAVRSARAAQRSWSEIGAMLGVSKQAAQRKYAKLVA